MWARVGKGRTEMAGAVQANAVRPTAPHVRQDRAGATESDTRGHRPVDGRRGSWAVLGG